MDDYKGFVEFLRAHSEVSEASLHELSADVQTRAIPAGKCFFEVGAPAAHLGFVDKGLFKLHGQDSRGTPFVLEFLAEGEFVSDYAAMVEGKPSGLYCEAIEDGVVSFMTFERYQQATKSTPAFQTLARRVLEALIVKLSKRELQLLTMTAKERYLLFLAERGELMSRIAHVDLAAHLGITPVSLSRIRGQIQRERRANQKTL